RCDVQLRARLQDAWAELSHDDIYKQPDLPEDLRARAKDLAELLATADRIASDIRSRVLRETESPKHRPEMGRVSEAGLAFGFKEVFGRSPPDYVVRQALNLCDRLQILSLEGFPDVLGRPAFRERVDEAYRTIMGIGIWPEELFLAALYTLAKGEDRAIGWVRKKARDEWKELDEFARREALCCLPDTVEELIEAIESPGFNADINVWADAVGASGNCAICGTTVIQSFSFAESVVRHYEVPADQDGDVLERIEVALVASGAETGGCGDGSLCSYDNEQMARVN
ncbi:MAG: hypothetical protein OXI33_13395, partial [Chloroflexota bacterium]|nr:hypothetical protein [Chloroflexota bacterium]